MTRSRWVMLAGPPLLALVVGTGVLAATPEPGANAVANALADCPPGGAASGPAAHAPVAAGRRPMPEPHSANARERLDRAGALVGWEVVLRGPRGWSATMGLPPESIVDRSGDDRLVITSDDGRAGTLQVVDLDAMCARHVAVTGAIPRRAVLEPDATHVLVHLLARGTRRDLGIWRIALDSGRRERVLEPLSERALARAGIDRVWSTELTLNPAGTVLTVTSCDPDRCVTRTLDRIDGSVRLDAGTEVAP